MNTEIITPEEVTEEPVQLAEIVKSSPLEKTQGQKYLQLFTPYFNKMAEIEKKIGLLNTEDPGKTDIKIAREIRLALKDNRVAAEKKKDEEKASILIEGRLIDSLFGVVNNSSKALELKCADIEKVAEIKEAKRKEELKQQRTKLLQPYEIDLTGYDLGAMSDATFDQLLENTKAGYEKRLEDKRKEEGLKIALENAKNLHNERSKILTPYYNFIPFETPEDLSVLSNDEFRDLKSVVVKAKADYEAEQQKIKDENERLKKEAEEKEIKRKQRNEQLKPYIMFIRDYNAMLAMSDEDYGKELIAIDQAAKDHYAYEAKKQQEAEAQEQLQAKRFAALKPFIAYCPEINMSALHVFGEQEFEDILLTAKASYTKDEQEKQAAQLKADEEKKQAEKIIKDQQAADLAKKKAERAPDKEKLKILQTELQNYQMPVVKSAEAEAIVKSVKELLNKTSAYLFDKIQSL